VEEDLALRVQLVAALVVVMTAAEDLWQMVEK
jgi:hypothetical protein